MIDVTCPACGELAEVDPAKLIGVDILGCRSCDSQYRFTVAGEVLTFGEEVSDDEEDEEDEDGICPDCDEPIAECTCTDDEGDDEEDAGDEEDDDDEAEIEIEEDDEV